MNNQVSLDRVFGALGSSVRRAILMRLEKGEDVSVSALAAPLAIKLPSMLKHLDVLEAAQLITREKQGRTMYVRFAPASMAEATAWLRRYEKFWSASIDRLVAYAQNKEPRARKSRS